MRYAGRVAAARKENRQKGWRSEIVYMRIKHPVEEPARYRGAPAPVHLIMTSDWKLRCVASYPAATSNLSTTGYSFKYISVDNDP